MPNPTAEIQSRVQAAPGTDGPAMMIDKIVASDGNNVDIPKLGSTDAQITNAEISSAEVTGNFQATGRASFSAIKIPVWQTNYSYEVGEIFRRGNSIYFVEADHTSVPASGDFYTDWLVNQYVRPMGRHPGMVMYTLNGGIDPGSAALLADGSEYDIAGKEDLYRYLNYGHTATSITFTAADFSNNGGYMQINKNGHGFYEGQLVQCVMGPSGGTFSSYENTNLFVKYVNANAFQLSTIAHTAVTSGLTPLPFAGSLFLGTGHVITSRLWGVPTAPTKFRVPDFRGLFLAASGTNTLIKKYGNTTYSRTYGSYMFDKGLSHGHKYNDNGIHNYHGGNGGDPTPNYYVNNTEVPNQVRADQDEHAPVHAVVNCYICI